MDANQKYIYVCGRAGYLTIFDTDFNIVAELGEFNGDLRAHSVACDEEGNVYLFPTHANTEHQVIALKALYSSSVIFFSSFSCDHSPESQDCRYGNFRTGSLGFCCFVVL